MTLNVGFYVIFYKYFLYPWRSLMSLLSSSRSNTLINKYILLVNNVTFTFDVLFFSDRNFEEVITNFHHIFSVIFLEFFSKMFSFTIVI